MSLLDKKERLSLIAKVTGCLLARWCHQHNGGIPLNCPCDLPCVRPAAIQTAASLVDEIDAAVESGSL